MKGVVEVIGLVLFEHHGVHEAERKHGQRFIVDIVLEVDVADAVKSDRIADTVDYGEVVAVAESAFRDRHFFLIEACAAHVAGAILAHFPKVHSARVTVKKPSAPVPAAIDHVAATITVARKRDG
ncbi:MAG: dihydroneopterin aldolase [Bradyrhizobiaceae bacterium]|nr:dihydroneopterin aldolase [Bradyrhizobiaceae bacterium]